MATMFRGLGGMPGGGMEAAWFAIRTALNTMLMGKLNCNGTVTLTANAATTTLTDTRIGGSSTVVVWPPRTANAAAEVGAGTMYLSAPGDGSVVINHANNAQSDRTFGYVVIG